MDYARRLKALADEVGDTLQIIMRVYFEKPRTLRQWVGKATSMIHSWMTPSG